MTRVALVEITLALPDDATVEAWCQMGRLVATIECPNDAIALTQLSDALRAAVVAVDAQRAAIKT